MTDIKDKIKKLLALGTSPNENEARAALLKARELMAKHKMTEADFEDVKQAELKTIVCEDIKWTTDSGHTWMTDLCQLIADNYCCSAAWQTRRGTRTHTLVIAGIGEDADLCREVIKYAVDYVTSAIKRLERRSALGHGAVASSYAKGFILGLELAFEEQKDEHPEWGLIVVKPQEVTDYENGLGQRSVQTKRNDFDPLAYMRGQNDGQSFNMSKVIGSKETCLQ